MNRATITTASIGLMALGIVTAPVPGAGADGSRPPAPSPSAPAPAPAMPPDLARRIQEITDVVLENHIDPPAQQQMVLSGIKALYRAAGTPAPPDLSRRVSAVATSEQLAALLRESWPRATPRPVAAGKLAEALLQGLVAVVPGYAELMSEKERKVSESFAGNRYVGIHIALAWDADRAQPRMQEVFPDGPADRAGVRKDDWLETVDGVETKGTDLRSVVERLRGAEGTHVTIKVRAPKEAASRTMTIRRGQLPRATIQGLRKQAAGGWDLRLDAPDAIGYLKITEISASTPHELRKLARQLEAAGARALVLDLRDLGSDRMTTVLHSAVLLADTLLEGGPIGRVRTPRGETTYRADPDALFRGWPIAVLVNPGTSGAGEWIAAALQDNHRAVIVGWPTRGAGSAPAAGRPSISEEGPIGPPAPFEASVRSTIPVGDGRWAVSLLTGQLERGDGRPLADPEGILLAMSQGARAPRGGVQPDHPLAAAPAAAPGPAGRARKPDARTYAAAEPDEAPPSPAADPAITAAVKILHQKLEK